MVEKNIGSLHINESTDLTGGAELYISSLKDHMVSRGFPFKVVSGRPLSGTDLSDSYYIPGIHKRHTDSSNSSIETQIRTIMKSEGLGIINFHNFHNPGLYNNLSDLILVRTIHDSRVICPTEFKINENGEVCESPLRECRSDCYLHMTEVTQSVVEEKISEVEALNELDMLVVPSRYTADQLELNGVHPEKIEVIPLFLPKGIGANRDSGKQHSTDILFIGRLTKSKGLKEAISALAMMDAKVRMTVCGDGPELVPSMELAREMGVYDQVTFTGWVNSDERDSYLSGASVVVIPSMGPESFGLVGLEAMYHKKPVVGFNVGAICEWLFNNENGILLPRGDIYSLSKALEYLLANPSIARMLGRNGKDILQERFSVDLHMDRIINLYNGLLK